MFKQHTLEARAKTMHAAARVSRAVLVALVKRVGAEGRLYLAHAGIAVDQLERS